MCVCVMDCPYIDTCIVACNKHDIFCVYGVVIFNCMTIPTDKALDGTVLIDYLDAPQAIFVIGTS